jgi:hypothetical protein
VSGGATVEAIISIAYGGLSRVEDRVLPCNDLTGAIADLETLNNAVEIYQAGGRGSDRGHQFLTVFNHCIKPAYVRGASLRITYPTAY